MSESNNFTIYFGTDTVIAYVRMNAISEVKNCCALRKFHQISFGGKDINLVFIQVHFELIYDLHVVIVFQSSTNTRKPFVHAPFTFYPFVSPVSCKSTFCDFIHSFCSYLNFNPFVFRSFHRYVKTFISVRFGHTQPVTQSLWIGLVHICYQSEDMPTLYLFQF